LQGHYQQRTEHPRTSFLQTSVTPTGFWRALFLKAARQIGSLGNTSRIELLSWRRSAPRFAAGTGLRRLGVAATEFLGEP
jgi:hypothetical protein